MNKVDKAILDSKNLVPREGQRGLLSTNKVLSRCPSFGIKEATEDDAIEYLAEVLVGAFLECKKHEKR